METFQIEIRDIVESIRIWTGSENIDLQLSYEHVWSRVFGPSQFGPCITFDLSKIDEFEYVSLEESLRPGIELAIAEDNPWQIATLLFHTQHDLPDAFQLNGKPALKLGNNGRKVKKAHSIDIRKKVNERINKESTLHSI